MENTTQFFKNLSSSLGSSLTTILGVVLLLIIGYFIAKFLKRVTSNLIESTGVDEKLSHSRIRLSTFIGKLVYFLVMIFVFMLALEKLGLTYVLDPFKGLLQEFLNFVPNIIGAGLVAYIGYMLAYIVSELVGLSGETIQRFAPKLHLPENINLVSIAKKIVFIFIFIPLLIAALNILNIESISKPATNMLQSFFNAIPRILLATVIMIIFVVGGHFLSRLVKDLLGSFKFNETIKDAKLNTLVGKTNVENLIANIVYIFIVLFGLITAIDQLQFDKLTEIVTTITNLLGNVLFGLVILIIGNWVANIAADNFLKSDDNKFVASIIKIAIIAIFLAIGLKRMGIADDIIDLAFGITLGTVALTIILSFGLGGREAAGKQMERILNKFHKKS